MVKARLTLIAAAIAIAVALGSAGVWILIAEGQGAQERRAQFFSTSKTYPTTGGEKMKIEW